MLSSFEDSPTTQFSNKESGTPDLSTLGLTEPLLPDDTGANNEPDAAAAAVPQRRPKSASLSFSSSSGGAHPEVIPQTLAAFFSEIAFINPSRLGTARDDLSRCVYEQKWCDLICDQLASQVGTQCMEHGRMLRSLRKHYANAFQTATRLHSDALWQLDAVVAGLIRCWRRLRDAEGLWKDHEELLQKRADEKLADVEAQFDLEYKATAKVRSDATKEVERISNTLKTLNGIFKDMQKDKVTATITDLNSRILAQEKEIASLQSRNSEIKSAKDELLRERIKTTLANQEIEKLKQQVTEQQEQLAAKDVQISELTEEEYQRRVELEKLKAKMEDDDSSDEEDTTAQSGATNGQAPVSTKSTLFMARITEKGEVLWKQPMNDIENVAEEFNRAKPNHRLLCHSYRLLLPNLGHGNRPPRNLFWVRRCMRAVIHAKTMDDAALLSREENRLRFPEHVYAWYEPEASLVHSLDGEESADMFKRVNDDRWGLYYGVKHLAVDDAEAYLFFQFLDENKGEDYLAFFLFALQVCEGISGELLRKQFGPSQHGAGGTCHSFTKLTDSIQSQNLLVNSPTDDCSNDPYGCGGSQTVWLPLHVANQAAQIILASSTKENREEIATLTEKLAVDPIDRLTPEDTESFCCPPVSIDEGQSLATDESSLDSVGMEKKREVILEEWQKPKCVNLFLWLRHVMDVFEKEATHRRAAIRLMFDTATTGALTEDKPVGGLSMGTSENEEKYIDLPQFIAIARTVLPFISTAEAAAVFRESYNVMFPPEKHHKPAPPGITFSAFLQAAEARQFFSKSMQLPLFLAAEQKNNLTPDVTLKMRSLIHMHSEQLNPIIKEIKEGLPERAKYRIEMLTDEISNGLFDTFAAANDGAKVMRPLAAYRRLLAFLLHLRFVRHEMGDGFILKGQGARNVRANTMDKEFETLEKLGAGDMVKQLKDPNDHSKYITVGNETIKVLDARKVMAQSNNELDYLREIIMDFLPNARIKALKLIKEGTACVRLQRCWKKKLERECGPPITIRNLMRVGFIRGNGKVRERRVNRSVWWTQGMVAELFGTYLHVMKHSSEICQTPPTFSAVVYRFFINRWGCVSLAERDLMDFFLNVRNTSQRVPRCRLFAAFTRCIPRGSAEDRALCTEFGEDVESLHFYLRSVLLVHEVHEKISKMQAKKLNNSFNPSRHFNLFPKTTGDARGRDRWQVPCVVLTQCTKSLFQALYNRESSGRDEGGEQAYKQLLHKVDDLASGSSRLADVDDWTWLIISHWSSVKGRRRKIAYDHEHTEADDHEGRREKKKVKREAFATMGRFRGHSIDYYNDYDDNSTIASKAAEMAASAVNEGGKPPLRKASTSKGSTRFRRTSIDENVHADKEEFKESSMYHDVLQRAKDTNPSEAVSESLHKHMMSDINLPLPLSKLPATDGYMIAKQVIVSWAGFKRPMKFLMEELHPEGEDETQETRELTEELSYFEELVEKLNSMVDGNSGGGEGGEGGGTAIAARPSTATGDDKRTQVLNLALECWLLFRHLLGKVKEVHSHEAVHIDEEKHGTVQDPLMLVDHPLKDNWSVGRRPSLS